MIFVRFVVFDPIRCRILKSDSDKRWLGNVTKFLQPSPSPLDKDKQVSNGGRHYLRIDNHTNDNDVRLGHQLNP